MSTGRCRHDLFIYDADAAFAGLIAPYLEDGRAEDEAVMAVYPADKQALLRDALGPMTNRVDFADSDVIYTRPEAVLARYDATMRRLLRGGTRSIRFIGELPLCETPEQWDTWILYEALLNHAFAHFPVRIVCTYDERVTPAAVLATVRRAHPHIHRGDWHGGAWEDSPDFGPTEILRSATPRPRPLPGLGDVRCDDGVRAFRRRLTARMVAEGVPADKALELVLAAGELYANAVRHGDGAPTLRAGRVDGRFVCELADRGHGLDDPLAGYVPPRPGAVAGAGLWIARQLASRMELLPTPGGGPTARLWA
jgi:anti-sigma regulatory factor (Ser/Thr protein kinase)